jgi:hypothetical protein
MNSKDFKDNLNKIIIQLRIYAPHQDSRYFKKYMKNVEEIHQTFEYYAGRDKYFTSENNSIQLNMFNTLLSSI